MHWLTVTVQVVDSYFRKLKNYLATSCKSLPDFFTPIAFRNQK